MSKRKQAGNSEASAGLVVQGWFDAWAKADMDRARRIAPRLRTYLGNGDIVEGFDGFVAWFAERRVSEGHGFSYSVVDVRTTANLAVVLVQLHSELRRHGEDWMQVAVYRIDSGQIPGVWVFEDDRTDGS